MKITRIETIPYRVPYKHPMIFAAGRLDAAERVVLRIHTDEGISGFSEAAVIPMVYGESLRSIIEAVRLWFEPLLIGRDPFAIGRITDALRWLPANNTVHGAIDIALHDLCARAMNIPLWRYLGGEDIAMRVTHVLHLGEPELIGHEARAILDRDITSFKIKVGGDPEEDIARVRAVHDAVGDRATFFVDGNSGWSNEDAIYALTRMAEFGVKWAEEPSPARDVIGRKRLAAAVSTRILGDESTRTLDEVTRELLHGTTRGLCLKTTRSGYTASRKMVAMAEALGAKLILSTQADTSIGTAASLAFGLSRPDIAAEPGELNFFENMRDDILTEPLQVINGRLAPRHGPGLGVEIDDAKLQHYSVQ